MSLCKFPVTSPSRVQKFFACGFRLSDYIGESFAGTHLWSFEHPTESFQLPVVTAKSVFADQHSATSGKL